ncbi:MAG: DUF6525 family protein [Marinibacterium sp.]|nr:DUF6525 family protein [Marinibacterium sp.]
MTRNLGETTLPRRRRAQDPMRAYDALPSELRQWMANAALPWSPRSCARIWTRARQRGLSRDAALDLLTRTEQQMLRRDRVSERRA